MSPRFWMPGNIAKAGASGTAVMVAGLLAAGLLFLVLNRSTANEPAPFGYSEFDPVIASVFAGFGALLILRLPRNLVGWLFCLEGVLIALNFSIRQYAIYGIFTEPGSLPATGIAAWIYNWLWVPLVGLVGVCLPHFFPTGQAPTSRWHRVALASSLGVIAAAAMLALDPGPLEAFPAAKNPLGLGSDSSVYDAALAVGLNLMLLGAALGAFSQYIRFRRAQEDERHQIKWFMAAASLVVLAFAVQVLWFQFVSTEGAARLAESTLIVAVAFVPIATGVAILRYRLYDIDILINRTLVYVPLTAALAGIYVAMTGLLRTLFTELTDTGSDAAVAFSTLFVVALLTPLKNQLQAVTDRHFKERQDPTKELDQLALRAQGVVEIVDPEEFVKLYLELGSRATTARGAAMYLNGGGAVAAFTVGEWTGDAALTLPLRRVDQELGVVAFGARRDGKSFTPDEQEALERGAALLAHAIALQPLRHHLSVETQEASD